MKRLIIIALALLAATGTAVAQNEDEAAVFAGIFRGKLPQAYAFKYNGTYFWDQKAFVKGSVWYNGKQYDDVYLNADAYLDELQVRPLDNMTPVVVYRDQVAWFTMGDKRFVNLRYLGWPEAPVGFFEVIRDGKTPLLLQVKKTLRFDSASHGYLYIGTETELFDSSVSDFFAREEHYYALENGTLRKIRKRALNRMLREPAGEPVLSVESVRWHAVSESPVYGAAIPAELPGSAIGLPDNYFSEKQQDTITVQYVDTPTLATYRNKVYTIGDPAVDKGGPTKKVQGIVTDAETGEPMYGVVVFDDATKSYTRTDRRGHYTLNVPGGENVLNFSADGKEDQSLRVIVQSDGGLNVMMTEKVTMLKEAVVSAESMAQHRNTEMGVEKVSVKTMTKIPSAFGEGDVIKAVLTLPGVKSVGEASGGFNVRGGSADQNLILFNGSTIYNPTHLFGIFSAFNPDIVSNVELYKSSIPAEYGGRVSSVLRVDSKDGDMQKWKGTAGIGVLTSRLQVEGPIVKGKTSINAGGRITYSDWILKQMKNSAYGGGSAGFQDANLGITHRFNANNTLQAYGYYANDRFSFGGDTTFRYKNANASLVWKHRTEKGRLQINAGYDHYTSRLSAHEWAGGAYDMDTYIRQAYLRADRKRTLNSYHELSWGVHLTHYILDPGIMNPYGDESIVLARFLPRENAEEPALYVSDTWKPSDELSLDGGIRLSAFYALKDHAFYVGLPDVRLAAKYSPAENLSFKVGANTLSQYIHLISNTSAVSPMDTWKLSDADIRPTWGWQAAGGAYWTELNTGIDFSAELYFKNTRNALDYRPGAQLSMNPNLAEDLLPVFGRSYGVELMAKKTTGKITGWLSYTYSRAHLKEMQDRGNETIANGGWYNAPYDKPHEFKLVTNFALTHRYSFSVNVDYSTGRPVTVPVGMYYFGGKWRMAYLERNSFRIPDYFRTDVAFNIDPGHYLKAAFHTTITVGVYNVTGRKNPYSVFFKNTTGQAKGYMLSVFATQIPYLNLNILF